MSNHHDSNRDAWNQAATYYRQGIEQSVAFLKNGGKNFCPPELQYLQNLDQWCKKAIHLQCAGGTDTLSLINMGAHATLGIDISEEMIAVAEEKTKQLGFNSEWLASDVFNVPSIHNGTADLVYTGRGAINWIMDLSKWASTINRLLKNGGKFYIFEGHPVAFFFSMTADKLELDAEFEGYFAEKIYESNDWPETYVGEINSLRKTETKKYERAWPVSQIINQLLATGLVLEKFEEHPDAYWKEFPNLPDGERQKFPNTYSLLFTKPG